MSGPFTAERRAADLWWRAALVVLAATLAAVGPATVTSWVTTPLCLLAALAAVECLARRRAAGWLDALAFGVGGLLILVVLVGLLLDVVPGGITRLSWAIALGVAGLLAVGSGATGTRARAMPRRPLPRPSASLLWYPVAGVLVVVAVVVAVSSTRSSLRTPAQLSLVGSDSVQVQTVRIQAGPERGRYLLTTLDGARVTAVAGPFTVPAGGVVRQQVTVPPGSRLRVELRRADSPVVVRSLILQRGTARPIAAAGSTHHD